MLRRHCSDEQLLRHLDGELPLPAASLVGSHLKRCWSCRQRQAELESQVHEVAKACRESSFPGPDWILDNVAMLTRRQEEYERSLTPAPQFRTVSQLRSVAPAAIAAVALMVVLIGALATRSPSPEQALTAQDVIARARRAETVLIRNATHQRFQVEAAQIQPEVSVRSTRLEVWSDPESGRFKSRWTDDAGAVKQALWAPELSRKYIYDPETQPGVVQSASYSTEVASLADLARFGFTVEDLEDGFMEWLRGRQWRPISLVQGLEVFSSTDGVVARVERVDRPGGVPIFRITAERRNAANVVAVSVEVDVRTYRPRLQRVRFESGARIIEFRLIMERVEAVPPARLRPVAFEPDLPFAARRGPLPVERKPELVVKQAPAIPSLSPSQRAAREIRVCYAVHRAKACLGRRLIIITTDPSGAVSLRGIVGSPEEKARLFSILADLGTQAWLQLDVKTVGEAVADAGTAAAEGARLPTEPKRVEPVGGELLIHPQLRTYFSRHVVPAEVEKEVRRLAYRAVKLSQVALDEAWALKELAERYGSEQTLSLDPELRWLVEVMVRDHLTALREHTGSMAASLEPALREAGFVPVAEREDLDASRLGVTDTAVRILHRVERIHEQIQNLFVLGAGLPAEMDETGRLNTKGGEEVVSELLTELPRVTRDLQGAEQVAARHFGGGQQAAFHERPPE